MKENNMRVFRAVKHNNYLTISKEVLFRKDLSLQAKALHAILMSLNEESWELTLSGLATLSSNGISATRSAMLELEKLGYVVKEQTKQDDGRFGSYSYVVYETLDLVSPKCEKPKSEKPKSENRTQLITNSIDNYTILNNNSRLSKNDDVYEEVIGYLNQRTGKAFKTTTKSTQKLINGRLNDGYTVDDFKQVIDNKVSQWNNDVKMRKYLRPQTLFNPTNFESYLNESETNDLTIKLLNDNIKTGGRLF